jgi:ABC-type nitrate/sulfonate/bicarbonate transport system substrate-binding protein
MPLLRRTTHTTPGRMGVAVLLYALLAAACGPSAAPAAKPASAPASAPAAPAASVPTPPSIGGPGGPSSAPIPVRVAWAAPGGALTPVWVAADQGFFRDHGLDVELVFLSGTRTDQGVITGETPIGFGANVIPLRLSGADIVNIAAVVSTMPYVLYGRPGLTSPQDLRGKVVVATLPGASSTSAAHIGLRHFGLEPNRDVSIQPSQGTAEQLTIVSQGLADAAFLSPPAAFKAPELGLVALANMADLHIPFMLTGIGVTSAYARDNAEIVRRFLRGYVAAVAFARKEPAPTKALIGKYTQTEDAAVLDATYDYYAPLWGRPDFRVPPAAIDSILRVMDVPGADTAKPEDFSDNRFVDELHQSGFIRQVGAD